MTVSPYRKKYRLITLNFVTVHHTVNLGEWSPVANVLLIYSSTDLKCLVATDKSCCGRDLFKHLLTQSSVVGVICYTQFLNQHYFLKMKWFLNLNEESLLKQWLDIYKASECFQTERLGDNSIAALTPLHNFWCSYTPVYSS